MMANLVERCRLCLGSKSTLVSITEKDLKNLLENLLRLTLLPKNDLICADCYKKIVSFDEFTKMCQKSEKLLKEEEKANHLLVGESETDPKPTVTLRRRNGQNQKLSSGGVTSFVKQPKRLKQGKSPAKTEVVNKKVPNSMRFVKNNRDAIIPVTCIPVVTTTEDKNSTFQCNKCHDKFQTKLALDVHLRQHCEIQEERCAHCNAICKTPYELKLHTKTHVNSIVVGMKAKFQETFNESKATL